jgi:ABC-type multidrug transport system fused ATPase/permease subunit
MRVFFSIFGKYNMKYQKSKAEMSSVASECMGNIRTVKAFADEMGGYLYSRGLNPTVDILRKKKSKQ